MRERALAINGQMVIASTPADGTRVTVRVPTAGGQP
jgi:signal transduction histidine kinase